MNSYMKVMTALRLGIPDHLIDKVLDKNIELAKNAVRAGADIIVLDDYHTANNSS